MEHADQQIDVGSGRQLLEKVAALRDNATALEPFGRNRGHDILAIEHHATDVGEPGQDLTARLAIAAPDVGDQDGLGEVVSGCDGSEGRRPDGRQRAR
jgi:hypothetical protein